MTSGHFAFEGFTLDPDDRRLCRDGDPLELSGRYLDALALMLREQGRLVSKDRFLDEVWRGVPVTDEALTQCIANIRRLLGDEAARPRFIETVPRHGYRFIAEAEWVEKTGPGPARRVASVPSEAWLAMGAAGTIGGGMAGLIGGLIYGFAGASQPLQPGLGAVSVLLVLLCLTILVAAMGAAAVAFGIAASLRCTSGRPSAWMIAGGGLGGMIVGAIVKLLGLDAFNLLLGRSPGDITGALEGLTLGSAVGLGAWLATRLTGRTTLRRGAALAALAGALAGLLIPLLGGRLMAGSLILLADSFPDSRLRLDQLGGLFGEAGFGPVSQSATGALEGALFSGCMVAAMMLARRQVASARQAPAPAGQ